jgi:predicted DNA-binding protein YlxM (UPF0122 family)
VLAENLDGTGAHVDTVHENMPQSLSPASSPYRDRIELLRSRAGLLSGKDRLLMTMYLENGNSFRQMARLAGVNEANIARRIRRLIERLTGTEYVMCLRNRREFTKTELLVAKDHFIRGWPLRKIAARRRCTFYQARKIIKKVQRLAETAGNTTTQGRDQHADI